MLESVVNFNSQFFLSVGHQRRIYSQSCLGRLLKCHGIPIVVFLDDRLGGGATELTAKIHSLKVHTDLDRFGFLLNFTKSQWNPSHVIVWLGSVINNIQGRFAATEQRMRKLLNCIYLLSDCESRVVTAKDLASFIGMIISLFSFVGNVAYIMTRSLYQVLNWIVVVRVVTLKFVISDG